MTVLPLDILNIIIQFNKNLMLRTINSTFLRNYNNLITKYVKIKNVNDINTIKGIEYNKLFVIIDRYTNINDNNIKGLINLTTLKYNTQISDKQNKYCF
jgi:hypothetical protein